VRADPTLESQNLLEISQNHSNLNVFFFYGSAGGGEFTFQGGFFSSIIHQLFLLKICKKSIIITLKNPIETFILHLSEISLKFCLRFNLIN